MPITAIPDAIRRHTGSALWETEDIGRSQADVLKIGDMYLKTGAEGSLVRSAQAQEYFHKKGLTAPLIEFVQADGRDWLLMRAVPGRYACDEEIMREPVKLARMLGETVRMLHETDFSDCPLSSANAHMLEAAEKETGFPFAGDTSLLRHDVLLHGDMCLPNIFFGDNGFTGFIDLGESGPGDRHFDLYWAMWSLEYNLKTPDYNGIFMDAYGRDAFDKARYQLCAELSECV